MKVERKKEFAPIAITLETEEEVLSVKYALLAGRDGIEFRDSLSREYMNKEIITNLIDQIRCARTA